MSVIERASALAFYAHAGQKRKYTGEPYIFHPARVAGVASALALPERVVAAAWLHDVIEDCAPEAVARMRDSIPYDVVFLVEELTNIKNSGIPRAEWKANDRARLRMVSRFAKIIKLIDRLDNLRDTIGADPEFARLYGSESILLVEAIAGVNPALETLCLEAAYRLRFTTNAIQPNPTP